MPWDEDGERVKNLAQGAATTCYVATSPDLEGVNGYYFYDCNRREPSALMRDEELAKRLWDFSEEIVSKHT